MEAVTLREVWRSDAIESGQGTTFAAAINVQSLEVIRYVLKRTAYTLIDSMDTPNPRNGNENIWESMNGMDVNDTHTHTHTFWQGEEKNRSYFMHICYPSRYRVREQWAQMGECKQAETECERANDEMSAWNQCDIWTPIYLLYFIQCDTLLIENYDDSSSMSWLNQATTK